MNQTKTIAQWLQTAVDFHQHGRVAEAEQIYRAILAHRPDQSDALHLLGLLADQQGRSEEAVQLINRAIALLPGAAAYHYNLGNALGNLGRSDESIAAYSTAAALEPGNGQTHNNLGIALCNAGRWDESAAALNDALRLLPNSANVHTNLAMLNVHRAMHDEAIAAYDRALTLEPPTANRMSSRIATMHYDPRFEARDILRESKRFDEFVAVATYPHENIRDPDRKLRIGYVSPDLRSHVVGRCMLSLLPHHDRDKFEIHCYSSIGIEDSVSARLREQCDGWHPIARMSDDRAAEMIRIGGIDILVDLAVHTQGNRLPLFARKPAPVQITYLGCCSTTGLSAMDYRVSDPYSDPPGADLSDYSEKTIRLPQTHLCYEPPVEAPEVSPPPVLSARAITFGCMNNFTKCSSAALDLWIKILQSVPHSRLILHSKPGKHLENVRARFERAGIAADRLEFVGQVDTPQYFQTYNRIDIALDPFPYNGAVTSCDTLWMGVPLITLSGKTAVGRMGRSILSNIGLPDFVAETPEQYVALATSLAGDIERLKTLRAELRPRLQNSPLMNPGELTRNLEAAYREAWRNFANSESEKSK